AEAFVVTAAGFVGEEEVSENPALVLVPTLRSWLMARRAPSDELRGDVERCAGLVAVLGGAMPPYAIEGRVLIAPADPHLGDYRRARMVLHEAEHHLELLPDSGSLRDRLVAVREQIDSYRVPVGLVASRLTPAEVRVLRLLPTHLSFPEIADALFVS